MRSVAFGVALATMFIFGAVDISRGIMAPLMQADWQMTYLQLGTAFSINSLGYLLGSFLCGFALEKVGIRNILLVGGCLALSGIVCFVASAGGMFVVFGFLLYGLGSGTLEIGVNGVVPAIAASAAEQSKFFNTLHGLYGLGGFGFPVVAVWLLHASGSWRWVFVVLAASYLVVTCIPLFHNRRTFVRTRLTYDEELAGRTRRNLTMGEVYRSPLLYFFLAAILAYVMAEAAMSTWLPSFLVGARHFSVGQASYYLSGFYILFTAGRLTAPLWIGKLGSLRAVLVCSGISTVAVGAAWAVPQLSLLFIVAGAGFSIVFPTVAAIASDQFHGRSATVLGFLFTAGGLGTMAVNALIGWLATTYSLNTAFSLVFVFLLAVVIGLGAARRFVQPTPVLDSAATSLEG